MPQSDDNVLDKAIEGDHEALRLLIKEHAPPIRQFIANDIPRRFRSVLSEDDVMQQTFAEAVHSIKRFVPMGDGSFGRWLADLARCNLHNAVKMLEARKRGGGRRRIDKVNIGDSHHTLLRLLASDGTSPTQHVAREEVRSAIEEAIQRLPDTYRKVVTMYDIDGASAEEVAASMKRSVGAVYMLRARAHDRLRTELGSTEKFFSRPE